MSSHDLEKGNFCGVNGLNERRLVASIVLVLS
jgi:hypothetical protein